MVRTIAALVVIGVIGGSIVLAQTAPIPVKVVVVTMFERGEDTGDTPGEYQLWVERELLNGDGVLGMVTGIGTAKAADVSLGSAVWADHVIDGDIAYEGGRRL